MYPRRNDKFKHTEPKFHNTKDKFGNQLEIGDIVYYLHTDSIFKEIRMGTVTHFTKSKIGINGIAREFQRIAKVNGTAKPPEYDKDKTDIEMQNQLDDENRRVMVNWSDNDFTK